MTVSDWTAGAAVLVALMSAALAARNSSRATAIEEERSDLERVKELRADATEARNEARAARQEAAQARVIAGEAHRRADEVVAYLGWVLRMVYDDPTMTMELLRTRVRDSVPPVTVHIGGPGPHPRRDHL